MQSLILMTGVRSWLSPLCWIAVVALTAGCTSLAGPRLRYATQTREALAAIENEEVVWLEFREGDVVPLEVRVAGLIEGATEAPISLVARRTFFLVHRQGAPMQVSVDGETVLDAYPGRGLLAFGVEDGAPQLGLLLQLSGERPGSSGTRGDEP